MAKLNFTSEIRIYKANPYIRVSAEQALRLKPGWKKPLPVLVQINGKPDTPWRINMMPVGDGSFYLYLHGNARKASQTKAGDIQKEILRYLSALKSREAIERNLKRALHVLSGKPERFMARSWDGGK
jgi:hypothetical protein